MIGCKIVYSLTSSFNLESTVFGFELTVNMFSIT